MKNFRTTCISILITASFIACKKDAINTKETPLISDSVLGNNNPPANPEVNQIIYIPNPTGGNDLKAVLFIPASDTAVPAVVVQHGSSGLWTVNDTIHFTIMANQFKSWIDSFRVHKIAALFVDSYTARGFKKNDNLEAPQNAPIAAEYVRPRDAYAGLTYLRANARIKADKIALMGFSHGASSVLSTMVNTDVLPANQAWAPLPNANWGQYNSTDKKWYYTNVLSPAARPVNGGFIAAVSYYPGIGMYSYYYTQPATPSNGKYVPYAPILLFGASLDNLYKQEYTNANNNAKVKAYDAFVAKAVFNGSSFANNNQVELTVFNGTAHSFDGKTEGTDGASSAAARTQTIQWLKTFFNK